MQAIDDDRISFYEGCLSVPGLTGVVARHRAVRVEALDQFGQLIDHVFSGWAARIVQHEVDHLPRPSLSGPGRAPITLHL